jgi:hypothetical protein
MKYWLIFSLFLFACTTSVKRDLPDELCYYKFVHVKELYDSINTEKFIGYKVINTSLSVEERDTLLQILREQHKDFIIGENGDVLISKATIMDMTNMSAIDGLLDDRIQKRNRGIN